MIIIDPHNIGDGRIFSIDGLRGFAVLVVFLSHTLGIPAGGELGVDIFFVMSGYLISTLLLDEKAQTGSINLRLFYWKRCKRLIPAFIAVCFMYFAISMLFPETAARPNVITMLGLLVTSNIYWAASNPPVPFLQHTWSLAVEWQFYLAWPLVLLALSAVGMRKRGLFVFVFLTVVGVWIARFYGDQLLRFDGILIGSMIPLLKDNRVFRQIFNKKRADWYFFIPSLIAIFIMVAQPVNSYLGPTKPIVSVLTAVIISYLIVGEKSSMGVLLDNSFLRYFGRISYGLYLYHFPIAALMYVHGMKPVAMLLASICISIPIAELSWRYLELPLMQWRGVEGMMKAAQTFLSRK